MSFALMFSGQGTQHPDMLPWLAEDVIVQSMCTRLGEQDWRSVAADPAWVERNANAQVLLTGLALAAWSQIAEQLPAPSVVAGCSLGELAAFSVSGVFDAATALDLAVRRAVAMDRCAAYTPGGLLGVFAFPADVIERQAAGTRLDIAIRNGPESVVLGGPLAELDAAERLFTARGARCTRLRVGVASHTRWMRWAADEFLADLSDVPFSRPHTALYSNFAAERIYDGGSAKQALAAQIASTVKWDECMEAMHAQRVRCALEIGPGQALARMWNDRFVDVPARSCDEFRSASAVARWVASFLEG